MCDDIHAFEYFPNVSHERKKIVIDMWKTSKVVKVYNRAEMGFEAYCR